jgi:hypothetical protein
MKHSRRWRRRLILLVRILRALPALFHGVRLAFVGLLVAIPWAIRDALEDD